MVNAKKKVVVSFKNLSPELQEEVKKQYPLGFSEKMIDYHRSAEKMENTEPDNLGRHEKICSKGH